MDRRYRKKMASYWMREKKKSILALDELNYSSWFDYWHLHPDWYAKGNRFAEDKRCVALSTYDLLVHAENKLQDRVGPYQVWATICQDTADNAVYIHTENENRTKFPHAFEGVQWHVPPPNELENIVNLMAHKIGKVTYENSQVYIVTTNA